MEEIKESLQEIVKQALEECKKNKTVPSKEILDIVSMIITYDIAH